MLPYIFIPFPDLRTENLLLRQLHIDDDHSIFALRSNDSVNAFIDRPKARTVEEASQFILKINESIHKGELIFWAVTIKSNKHLVGTICLWNISQDHVQAEIGYELLPGSQGKGIMQEAIPAVLDYGFKRLRLKQVVAELHPGNIKSIKLLEKNGFVLMPVTENLIGPEAGWHMVTYILRRQYH